MYVYLYVIRNTYYMKIKTLSDVRFFPEKRYNKEDGSLISNNVPIIAGFSYEGKRLIYYTGERIDLNKWDYDTQRVKEKHNGRTKKEINSNLEAIAGNILNVYNDFRYHKKTLPVSTFRNKLKELQGDVINNNSNILSILAEKFLETSGGGKEWTKGTQQKIRATTNHMIKALGDLKTTDIDESVFSTMQEYFQNEGMVNNTIKKNLKVIKWFLRWLIKYEYITGKAATNILNYQPKLKDISENQRQKKNLIALTKEEIEAIKKAEIPETKRYLERIRDVFLFQCFTGLRYSDVYQLKKHNIVEKNGSAWLSITTTKDSEFIEYKMIPQAFEIIEKYKDSKDLDYDRVLPVISNQRMNEYLKELGKLAELDEKITKVHYRGNTKEEEVYPKWQLLTTHVGRKTFITTAVEAGVPMDELMKIVGHSDFEMLKVYYTVRDERLSSAMDKIGSLYG